MITDSQRALQARTQTGTLAQGIAFSIRKDWTRAGFMATLILAALLNVYGLEREGYANTYYAAGVRSMMENWHAFFFNSLDSAGFVTIDKPPLGFWLQVLSAKIFGFNGVALMLPQALAGVASVALLYYLVGRIFGRPAGLLAGLALAITPISVVANRNNIVDSTLVLAVLLGAWAVTRAVETGRLRWLALSAVFVGLGFNIKMLQAFLVLPAFGLMYLLGARTGWGRRVIHLGLAAVVLLIVSLSWVTAVDLTPAGARPWVGSTTNNSELSLAIGYNGLQRLTGNSAVGGTRGGAAGAPVANQSRTGGANPAGPGGQGSSGARSNNPGPGGAGGGPGGVGENGPVGPLRLLDTQLGGQISWLLPLAVVGFVAAAWWNRRRFPLSREQSALVLWGTWLLTMGVFFSIAGFYHTYYLVMMGPAVAALAAIGIITLWRMYRAPGGRMWFLLPIGLLAAGAVQLHILADFPAWSRWMSPLILGLSALAALALTVLRLRPAWGARVLVPALLVGVGAVLVGPAVWSIQSVNASNSGLIPRAGPAGATGMTGGFGGGGPSFRPTNGTAPGGPGSSAQRPPAGAPAFGPPPGVAGNPGAGRGGPGGDTASSALVKYLEKHQGSATYLLATTNANSAAPYIIATGKPVMALGGFTGSDPILTTSKLAALVKQGVVRYFLLGGGGPGGPGGGDGLSSWVQSHCSVVPASAYRSSGAAGGGAGSLYVCGAAK